MSLTLLSQIFLITIAAMSIAEEHENFPSQVAYWPHCCDFEGDTRDGLGASRRVKIAAKGPISSHRVAGPYVVYFGSLMSCLLYRALSRLAMLD